MTLHEAIEQVLQTNGKPLSTSELAQIINDRNLYLRRDNTPVSATQIAARVGNYQNIFNRVNGKISLIKNDRATQLFQTIRNDIAHNYSEIKLKNNLLPLDILQKGIDELLKKDNNIVKEPAVEYGQQKESSNEDLEAIFKLCHWFLLQESNFGRNNLCIINEEFITLLSGLDWFNERNNTLISNTASIDYFLFKIIKENKNAVFAIEDNSNPKFTGIQSKAFNDYLIELYHKNFAEKTHNNYRNLRTELIIPPLGYRLNESVPIEFAEILNEISTREKKLDKAILLVSIGTLMSSKKSTIEARKNIMQSNFLDTIVELPVGVIENTGVKMALLLFDFNRSLHDSVFFLNISEFELSELPDLTEALNKKSIVDDFSVAVSPNIIESNDYNLLPTRYISNATDFERKKEHRTFSLRQILLDKKTGTILNYRKSNFYSGGEYKLLRNSDLNSKSIYFTPTKDAIGIDGDQLAIQKLNLISGGLVLSAINKNVKSNVLPDNENFIIGNHIHWLKPNAEIVSDEYLAQELVQPYVLKQYNLYSSGHSHIPLIHLNDLLKVQVQIPSLAVQRDLLLNDIRNKNIVKNNIDTITDRELDFVKTLKHTLKQPTAGLSNDFASLKYFLNSKVISQEALSNQETIVPIFEGDTAEMLQRYTMESTLARMERSLTDIDYILEQAITLIGLADLNKKPEDLKQIFNEIKSEYPHLKCIASGKKTTILADKGQLKIAFRNIVDNAINHGFKNSIVEPIIWLEIQKNQNDFVKLSIRNNGKPLPSEFTIDDFLAKGKSSKADVGSGFGGFLIGQILKNHKGEIVLNNNVGNEILPHNVEFIISLPK